ncbi:MAG TPA: hypothetical protein VKY57_04865 [Chitinispirillaceae bacterium]|nr:hypothetical protein [Chitinispirillaceae bacterium]
MPFCLIIVHLTESAPRVDQLYQEYKSSKSGQVKTRIIRSLINNLTHYDDNDIKNIEIIIHYGLNEKEPLVVQEAIFAAGKFKSRSLMPELNELYRKGCNQYPGSQSIIKQKIIKAIGKIGGDESEKFFTEEIINKKISRETEMILSILLDKDKLSEKLVSSTVALRDMLLQIINNVETTPENSIKYSQHRMILSLANTLITKNTQFE